MKKDSSTELLAPAKDKETAIAAINCGADAIYIGPPAFGARKNASNSIEDIREVVEYAHKFWAKVYVTLNTILTDEELNEAVKLAKKLAKIGVDALIIQDLGLLKIISEENIIPVHMSTQCDNYDPQKIKFFNDIGVSRVVLARETSLETIKKIHKENPNLELEGFIHGALCVSMSGQCYLSEFIGRRSANRGECAQPCRKKYTVETEDGKIIKKDFYALCLKDFNASDFIQEMIDAGIKSFKIEGRLKDINYVKNVVSYYRKKIGKGISSGKCFYEFEPDVTKSFNRGFTSYFLKDRENCFSFDSPKSKGEFLGEVTEIKKQCFKIKTSKKIHAQDGLFFNSEGCLVNKVENNWIYPNKKIKLNIGDIIYRNQDVYFEKELEKITKRQIGLDILIKNNRLYLTDEDGITVSKELKNFEKSNNPSKMKETFSKQFSKTGDSLFYIKEINIDSEIPFMPISTINQLRRDLLNELLKNRIEYYNQNLKEKVQNIKLKKYYIDSVDYKANIHNKEAESFYEKCGVKVLEHSFESKHPNRQIVLMRCKHCIKYALNMCKSPQKLILKDEYNNIYPLRFDCKNCEMHILSP